jgi:phosphoribosyl-dephospho-CoA transferase
MGLAEAAACAGGRWRAALKALVGIGDRWGGFGVYGSHMWQAASGRRYVRDDSDIDLWIPVRRRGAPGAIGAALCDWERETGLNADGEFVLPGGAAVSWKEFHAGKGRKVLVKRISSVELAERRELLDALPD